jgi:hypothetical protein
LPASLQQQSAGRAKAHRRQATNLSRLANF